MSTGTSGSGAPENRKVRVTSIRGSVRGPNGDPVAEASVYFMEGPVPLPDIAQLTDDKGRFQMAVPVPGTYRIGVRAGEGDPTEVTVEVQGEEPVEVEVRV